MINQFTTKTLTVVEQPTEEKMGIGIFEFTDDYSVFHYGKMPDQIPGKGEAICRMTVANLELLADIGIETHLRRYIPPNKLEVNLVQVFDPKKNPIRLGENNYFIPLQVIYRNTIPDGSSIFRRLRAGTVTLTKLGLNEEPLPGQKLPKPLVEFTTKEELDKYIDEDSAITLAALSKDQVARIKDMTIAINDIVSRHAEALGLVHADGKAEFAITPTGSIMVVDSVGTPDENRFIYKGVHIGKQVLRDYYASIGFEAQIQNLILTETPKQSWPLPERLPKAYISTISQMYLSLCEKWLQAQIWNAPSLDIVINSLRSLYDEFKFKR